MMTTQTRHIILFFLLAIASYALWRYYFFHEEIIKDQPFTKGYSVEDIELKITNEAGELSAKFASPSLIRYTDSSIINITTPVFWTYSHGKEKWIIKANEGEFNTSNDNVFLQGELLAKSLNSETETTFKANNLHINLDTKHANTNDGIQLHRQPLDMKGQIAQFDLNNETIEVNKNVKAIYKAIH